MSKLFDSYTVDPSRYNEVFAADGSIHPHWLHFAETLAGMTAEQMQQRADSVSQQINENGVTYNVYADPNGSNRPWRLGPVPNLVPAEEWRRASRRRPTSPAERQPALRVRGSGRRTA